LEHDYVSLQKLGVDGSIHVQQLGSKNLRSMRGISETYISWLRRMLYTYNEALPEQMGQRKKECLLCFNLHAVELTDWEKEVPKLLDPAMVSLSPNLRAGHN